jgi:hypothetical protein
MMGLQVDPSGFAGLAPPFSQRAEPVRHDVTPSAQGSPGVHALPTAHTVQTPALHTLPGPQLVPFGALVAVSTQLGPPAVVQLTFPMRQALGGEHTAPALQTVMVVESARLESSRLVATSTSTPDLGGAV